MTTNAGDVGGSQPASAYQRGSIPAMWATSNEMEHKASLKRLVLVGALASFLSLFGLTIAFDYQSQQAQPVGQASITSSLRLPLSGDDDHDGSSNTAAPQIRTKTS